MTKALKEEVKRQRKTEKSLHRKLSNRNFDLTEDEAQLLMDKAEEAIVEAEEEVEQVERTMAL